MPDSVLIISAVSPVPVDNGKRLILHGLLGYFVDRLGPENVHYAFLGSPGEARPNFPGIAHRLSRPGSGAQLLTLVRRFATDRSCSCSRSIARFPPLTRRDPNAGRLVTADDRNLRHHPNRSTCSL